MIENDISIKYYVPSIQGLEEWIINTRSKKCPTNPELQGRLDRAVIQRFYNHLQESREIVQNKSLLSRVQPVDTLCNFQSYLFQKLEFYVERVLIFRPDHSELKRKFQEFLYDFAQMRYRSDPQISLQVRRFLDDLKSELNRIDEAFDDSLLDNAKELIDRDIDLLDVPIQYFIQKDLNSQMTLQVELTKLLDRYQYLHALVISRFPKALEFAQKRISPFLEEPQHAHINYSEVLNDLVKSTRKLLPKFNELAPGELEHFGKFFLKYLKCSKDLIRISDCIDSSDDILRPRFGDQVASLRTFRALIRYFESNGIKDDDEVRVDDLMGSIITMEDGSNTFFGSAIKEPWGKLTLQQIKRGLEFFEAAQDVHIVLDTYISSLMNESVQVLSAILGFTDKHRRRYLQDCNRRINAIRNKSMALEFSPSVNMAELAAGCDQQLKKTNKNTKSSTNGHSKKTQAKEKTTAKPTAPPAAARAKVKRSPAQLVAKHLFSSKTNSMNRLLNSLVNSKSQELRQARMHLMDLAAFESREAPLTSKSEVFGVVSSCYYFLEQLLTHASGNRGHNLIYLHNSLNHRTLDRSVAKELSLANFWTSYLFEEMNQMRYHGVPIPELLKDLKSLYETGDLSMWQEKLPVFIQKSCDYAAQLISTQEVSLQFPVMEFTLTPSFDPSGHLQLLEKVTKLNSTSDENTQALIKQGIMSIEMGMDCLSKLASSRVSSLEFPHLVRQALFWHHHMMESFLKASLFLKTCVKYANHELKDLALIAGVSGDTLKLFDDFNLLYQTQRYPYLSEPKSLAQKLVVQAEHLREHPEIEEGFQILSSKAEETLTPDKVAQETTRISRGLVIATLTLIRDGLFRVG